MTPSRIVWIDDSLERRRLALRIFHEKCQITAAHPAELNLTDSEQLKDQLRADIVVVDYDLSQEPHPTTKAIFPWRAPAIVGLLGSLGSSDPLARRIPVYVVSSHFEEKGRPWSYSQLSSFDRILDDVTVEASGFAASVLADIESYRSHLSATRRVDESLVNQMMRPPASAIRTAVAACSWFLQRPTIDINQETSQSYQVTGELDHSPLELSRWVRHHLMRLPGPLLDSFGAAAFLGLKHNSFIRMEERWESASYRGIFHHASRLWWREELSIVGMSLEVADNDMEFCPLAAKRGEKSRVDTLAFAADSTDRRSDKGTPVSRLSVDPDETVFVQPLFERFYRIPR